MGNFFVPSRKLTDRRCLPKTLARFQALSEWIADGILIINEESTILYANQRCLDMFGFSKEELIGKPLDALIPAEYSAQHRQWVRAFFAEAPKAPISRAVSGVCRNGMRLPVDVSLQSSKLHSQEEPPFAVAQIRNNAQAHRALADVQRAKDSMEVFLRTVNHDLRTALNAIVVSTSILKESSESFTAEQRECVNILEAGSLHMRSIVTNVLDLSKIQSNKMELDVRAFNLRGTLRRLYRLNAPVCDSKGVKLALSVEDDVPSQLYGDSARVEQLLQNLLNNAVKFTPPLGQVLMTVAIDRPAQTSEPAAPAKMNGTKQDARVFVKFVIADTGCGIAPDKIGSVFLPFFQADSSTSRSHGGTGLGLSIASSIASLMDGQLTVVSPHQPVVVSPTPAKHHDVAVAFHPRAAEQLSITTSADASQPSVVSDDLREFGEKKSRAPGEKKRRGGDGSATASTLPAQEAQKMMATTVWSTIFTCVLPFDPAPSATVSSPTSASMSEQAIIRQLLSKELQPERAAFVILVVEDNVINQKLLLRILSQHGFSHADVACNGQVALDMVQAESAPDYRLILMDCEMPVMDGFEASRRLRAMHYEAPIVAITASATVEVRNACFEAGMSRYLTKPFEVDKLLLEIARLKPFCDKLHPPF